MNRTIWELKHKAFRRKVMLEKPLNRTIWELKQFFLTQNGIRTQSLNRTIWELKRTIVAQHGKRLFYFESYHLGIETSEPPELA